MKDKTKLDLIDAIIGDALEFGDDNNSYYKAVINAIVSINDFERRPKKSVHDLEGTEAEAYAQFRHKHWESCNNGTDFELMLKGTGVGESIEVKCPVCGESENITDISTW